MTNCWNTIRLFFRRDHGRALVHCAVMLELIAIVCLAARGSISTNVHGSEHAMTQPMAGSH